jgi:hypothetical protein
MGSISLILDLLGYFVSACEWLTRAAFELSEGIYYRLEEVLAKGDFWEMNF